MHALGDIVVVCFFKSNLLDVARGTHLDISQIRKTLILEF